MCFGSGEQWVLWHTWGDGENYTIRARAMDDFGGVSNWSMYKVSMSKRMLFDSWVTWIVEYGQYRFPLLEGVVDWFLSSILDGNGKKGFN